MRAFDVRNVISAKRNSTKGRGKNIRESSICIDGAPIMFYFFYGVNYRKGEWNFETHTFVHKRASEHIFRGWSIVDSQIISALSSTGENTKLHAETALKETGLCFVFRKNAHLCWPLNQQQRSLEGKKAPSHAGSPAVHHRVYVTSYFHTLRKSTDTASARVIEHEFIFQFFTSNFIAS